MPGHRAGSPLHTVLAGTALFVVLASGAHATEPVTVHCGQVITEDTTVANDLTDCPDHGLVIGADDVTLDLNGHTIDGDGAGEDLGIDNTAGHDGVMIADGSLEEFTIGVLLVSASDNRLRDVTVRDSHHVGMAVVESRNIEIAKSSVAASQFAGIVVEFDSSQVRINRTTVIGSGLSGVAVLGSANVEITQSALSGNTTGIGVEGSPRTRIEWNSISHNRQEGILIREGSDDSVVSQNSITGNADGVLLDPGTKNILVRKNSLHDNHFTGVLLVGSDDNVILKNSVVGNGSGSADVAGILLFAIPEEPDLTSDRNLISENTLTGNDPDGIRVDAGQRGNVLEENRSSENVDDGIDVDSPFTTLTGNTANGNGDLGIEAVPGVTDGGGNKARGNGNPLHCTNVFCK
jgi:parallel beta-helix repeat protein